MSLKGDLLRRGLMVNYAEIMTRVPSGRIQEAPVAMIGAATITVAAILNGLIIGTPVGDDVAYTLPTGAVLDAALTSDIIANDSFDFTIINLAATAGQDIILTEPASGITIVGSAVVSSNEFESSYYMNTGTFRLRKTAANTFVAYRIA